MGNDRELGAVAAEPSQKPICDTNNIVVADQLNSL